MSGTIRGRIDCYSNTGSQHTNAQTIFKTVYDFFKSHPNMSEIARSGGTGGTAASTGYWDAADPFRGQAWFVFRMNDATLENGSANAVYGGTRTFPWYVYVQLTRGDIATAYNSGAASPCMLDNNASISSSDSMVLIQFAIPLGTIAGTSEVAWNGGGSMGTNTKGSPVWKTTAGSPSGFQGSYVFPRSNNTGGTHATNRENCSVLCYIGNNASPVRYHMVADNDSIVLLTEPGDDANGVIYNYFGLFTPRDGITHPVPMVHLQGVYPPTAGSVMGPTTGVNPGGGVPMAALANGVRGVTIGRYDEWLTIFGAPNKVYTTEVYDEWNIPVISSETPTWYGLLGEVSFIREAFNLSTYDLTTGKTRAAFGSDTPVSLKLTIPWNGITTPRSNFTREGISFP